MKKRKSRKTLQNRTVRISIPAKVAYNLDLFQESIIHLVEELGCRTCFSGVDCSFQMQKNFYVNEDLKVIPQSQTYSEIINRPGKVAGGDPDVDPIMGNPFVSNNVVSVSMAGKVSNDIEQITKMVAAIADNFAHPQCTSGFDILFRNQLDLVANERGIFSA